MPSSINGHVERSEKSPLQSKGETDPFQNRHEVSSRTPFVRDLLFFMFSRGSLEGDPLTPSIELETPRKDSSG